MKQVTVPLSVSGLERLERVLQEREEWLTRGAEKLAARLASLGASVASMRFSQAIYTGTKDCNVTAEPDGNGWVVRANGQTVLFLEFGSGITYGYGHPEAGQHGMGPGTYPNGKGHWDDPEGWDIPTGEHTFGNPPSMAMYEAVKTIKRELPRIVQEVFQ